jgi:hypothetical protein
MILSLFPNTRRRALGLPIGFPTFKYYTDSQKLQTFDDLYKQNKKTRGRLGLNPDPDKRQDENPMILRGYPGGTFKMNQMVSKVSINKNHFNESLKFFARW